jgi:hypothetical protein
MKDADLVLSWIIISIVIVGMFMAGLRWYRKPRHDPLRPDDIEHRYSLRREK